MTIKHVVLALEVLLITIVLSILCHAGELYRDDPETLDYYEIGEIKKVIYQGIKFEHVNISKDLKSVRTVGVVEITPTPDVTVMSVNVLMIITNKDQMIVKKVELINSFNHAQVYKFDITYPYSTDYHLYAIHMDIMEALIEPEFPDTEEERLDV